MPDETTTPEAKAQLADLRSKLQKAVTDRLAGVAVDDGSGKDTHDSEFDATAVHIPAPPVTVSGRRRQLCAWCGHVLDDLVLSRVAVEAGDPVVPVWPAGQLVRFDGAVTAVVPYVDRDPLPDDCCALRRPETTEETSDG